MVLSPEQERVRTLLQDTITLLCRNGLSYQNEFDIKALIGITVDKENCFLIDIKDTIKNNANKDSDEENEDDVPQSPARKRKRNKRRRSSRGESDLESLASDSVPHTPVNNRVKAEEDEDSDDAIIIKDEPGYDNSNYGNNQDILGNLAQAQLFPATQESLQWDAGSPSFSIGSSQQQHHHQQSQHMNTSQNLGASTSTPSLQQQQQSTRSSMRGRQRRDSNMSNISSISSICSVLPHPATASGTGISPTVSNSGGPPHECPLCMKHFSSAYSLRRHDEGAHRGIFRHRCPHCDKGFADRSHLRGHLASQHTHRAEFSCAACGKGFSYSWHLKTHQTGRCPALKRLKQQGEAAAAAGEAGAGLAEPLMAMLYTAGENYAAHSVQRSLASELQSIHHPTSILPPVSSLSSTSLPPPLPLPPLSEAASTELRPVFPGLSPQANHMDRTPPMVHTPHAPDTPHTPQS